MEVRKKYKHFSQSRKEMWWILTKDWRQNTCDLGGQPGEKEEDNKATVMRIM